MKDADKEKYLKLIEERGKNSRIKKQFQLTGLMIADILNDKEHKSLYMKLAKKHGNDFLIGLAKDVAEREEVENKGAYFMRVLQNKTTEEQNNTTTE